MYINVWNRGSTIYARTKQGDFKYTPSVSLYQEHPEGKYTSTTGKKLEKREFENISKAKQFIKKYESAFKIYGQNNFLKQVINDQYSHTDQPEIKDIRIHNIDIEVDVPTGCGFPHPEQCEHPINAITITDNQTGIVHSWGLGEWNKNLAIERGELTKEVADRVQYKHCRSEDDLITELMVFWKQYPPHIISGWNSDGFDMPYIYFRIEKLFGTEIANQLSPWGITEKKEVSFYGTKKMEISFKGIALLDYMKLYKKFTFKTRDSYKLDAIATVELGKKKLSYDEEKDLFTLAANNFQKFISYNILDTVLIDELDTKLNLIPLAVDIAWKAQINYDDVFSPIRTWDALCCNALLEKGMVPEIADYGNITNEPPIAGGYVKAPIPGMYKDVFSFDLESLYPSILIQWNIGPDTILPSGVRADISEKILDGQTFNMTGYSTAASGCNFSLKKQSFIAEIMENLKKDRKKAKKEMFKWMNKLEAGEKCAHMVAKYQTRQMALKILLNSGYGALASKYFRFYDTRLAESITLTGQTVVKYIEKKINTFMNKSIFGHAIVDVPGNDLEEQDFCIAIDTDSVYFTAERLMDKYRTGDVQKDADIMDKLCKGIEENIIKPEFKNLFKQLNCFKPQMYMDREVIALNGFWTAKKRYALRVIDNEGVRYQEPHLKVMGLSLVQSKTPQWVRNRLENAIEVILGSEDPGRIPKFINSTRSDFGKLDPEDIAYNVRVGDISKYMIASEPYYKKGTQAQLKAVLMHNRLAKNFPSVTEINQGDSVKWSWMKVPNPIGEPVIAFDTFLPKEFELHNYICYNTQFNKAFKKPLTDICDMIGLKHNDVSDITRFFS